MSARILFLIVFCVFAPLAEGVGGFAPAYADGDGGGESSDDGQSHDADDAARSLKSGDILALRELARTVTARYPGEIIGTEFKTKKNVPIYEFYILQKNGRVREVKVNAKTGRILK